MKIIIGFIIVSTFIFTSCEKDTVQSKFSPSPIYLLGSSPLSYKSRSPYIKGWGDSVKDYLKNPNMAKNRGRAGSVAGNNPERGYDKDNYQNFEHNDWTKTSNEIKDDENVAKNGGFLLIQWGENEDRVDITDEQYKANLKLYIDRARKLNLIPVLITPIVGRNTTHSPFSRSLGRVEIKRQLAKEENVLLLDLYKKTSEYTLKLAEENEPSAIKRLGYRFGHIGYDVSHWDYDFFNSDFLRIDRVHLEPQGAKLIAGWVRDLACEQASTNDDAMKLCQQFNPDSVTQAPTIYSDGEHRDDPSDDDYNGWYVFDTKDNFRLIPHPDNSIISQSVKEGKENKTGRDRTVDYRVININTNGQDYFVIHGAQSPTSDRAWHNTEQIHISWSMKMDDIRVYIYVNTENGVRTLYYEDLDEDRGINPNNSSSIRYGVGSNSTNKWTTFNRNLDEDLKKFEPNNSIVKVNGFGVYGNGQIDNLLMY